MEFKKKEDKKDPLLAIWTREQENLLAEWAEKASCYRWLHSRCEKKYRCRNYAFTIPVIILSTLSGTANFGMDSFVPEENKSIAMAGVGSVNIIAGIISTLANFLRFAELMEAHRSSGVSWSKLGRDICVELALDPKRRKPASDFLNICRAEYDRLIEQSPLVDDVIIKQFHNKFGKTDINKPEMCNGLDKCEIYQLTEEEKISNIMTSAGEKFKKNIKWKPPEHVTKNYNKDNNHTHHKNNEVKHVKSKIVDKQENMRELSDLVSMGRVSAFAKSMNKPPDSPKSNSPKQNVVAHIKELNKGEENNVSSDDIIIEVDNADNVDDVDADNADNDADKDDNDDVDNADADGKGDNDEIQEDNSESDEKLNSEVKKFLDGIEDP
jgi:hypothetical protein